MKLPYLNLSLILLFFLTLTACTKDDDGGKSPSPTEPPKGKMTATIGENTFSSSNAVARYRTTGEFTLAASANDGESFFFVIDNFIGAVDYTFAPTLPNTASYSYIFNGATQNFATAEGGAGVLTITSYNESKQQISGTFTLTLAQVTNPGSSIQITEGEFTDVPITTLQPAGPGTMAYYADDVFYSTTTPDLSVSILWQVDFNLPTPKGDATIKLLSNHPEFNLDQVITYTLEPFAWNTNFAISDYALVDGKISFKIKNTQRDFELWVKDYPIETPSLLQAESGVLTFYTDTATFVSTSVNVVDFLNNSIIFTSENSNGTELGSAYISSLEAEIFLYISSNWSYIEVEGDGRVFLDDSGTFISYIAFSAHDNSIVMIGKDIPL